MKPLATPVLGGMISSLVHVLIVTPVIFFWIRERQLGLEHEPLPPAERTPTGSRGVVLAGVILVALAGGALMVWQRSTKTATGDQSAGLQAGVIQTVRSGEMEIVLLSPTGTLRVGRNTFTIEFRSPTGELLDAGALRVAANMPMPGMVMPGKVQVTSAGVRGRYTATAEFGMAGAWQMSIEWSGPAGKGSVSFEGAVQ
jgi:Cu(I)/Ag(I) efflux system membrane protein CusA/SilA